jgi:hypothetical protein
MIEHELGPTRMEPHFKDLPPIDEGDILLHVDSALFCCVVVFGVIYIFLIAQSHEPIVMVDTFWAEHA